MNRPEKSKQMMKKFGIKKSLLTEAFPEFEAVKNNFIGCIVNKSDKYRQLFKQIIV